MDLARAHGFPRSGRVAAWWTRLPAARRRLALAIAIVLAVLIALRLAAPYLLRGMINHALAKPGPYQGAVDDVSLALWRGRYEVTGFHLTAQNDKGPRQPVLDVDRIRVGLRWGPLLHGHVVGGIDIASPRLHLFPEPGKRAPELPAPAPERGADGGRDGDTTSATPPTQRWQDKLGDIAAIRIDEITISDGGVEYVDQARGFTAGLGSIGGSIRGLALGAGAKESRAEFRFTGSTVGGGRLLLEGKMEPLSRLPSFSARASLEQVELKQLNPIARNFDHLTFGSGTFSGYVELATEQDRLSGFFKPIFHDLDIDSFRDKHTSAATKLFWKAVVPAAEFVLENGDKSQHAARIPIKGTLEDPKTDAWTVIITALRNAFVQALLPGFGKD
jgi:hypothetical protein